MKIGIVAGEASGDLLGRGLIEALKERWPDLEFVGIAEPSGFSTFRIMLRENTDAATFGRYWTPLQALG